MFTDEYIKALKPKGNKFYDVREGSRKGFAITVFPSGEKSFIFFYHFKKRKIRMTIGRYPYLSLKVARILHEYYLEILENGQNPVLIQRFGIKDSKRYRIIKGLKKNEKR